MSMPTTRAPTTSTTQMNADSARTDTVMDAYFSNTSLLRETGCESSSSIVPARSSPATAPLPRPIANTAISIGTMKPNSSAFR